MVSGCEPGMQSQYLAGHTLAGSGGGVGEEEWGGDSGPLGHSQVTVPETQRANLIRPWKLAFGTNGLSLEREWHVSFFHVRK